MKREIVNFSKKISKNSNNPESKFLTDMIYGISKSKNILLSSIAEALNKNTKKAYTIDRLSNKFVYGLSDKPIMLASNTPIKSKEDVIKIARCYLNR